MTSAFVAATAASTPAPATGPAVAAPLRSTAASRQSAPPPQHRPPRPAPAPTPIAGTDRGHAAAPDSRNGSGAISCSTCRGRTGGARHPRSAALTSAPYAAPTPEAIPAPTSGDVEWPMTQMRKGIAAKMTQVKQTVPHAYTVVELT